MTIKTPALPDIPGLSQAKNMLASMTGAASGAASNAANLGNKLGDGAHNQLKDFGEQQKKNIEKGTDGAHAGWMTVHKGVDNAYLENSKNLVRFGEAMSNMAKRLPGPAADIWDGFRFNVDKGREDIFTHMQRLGDGVGDNIKAAGSQVGKGWQGVRNGVDGGIDNGRKVGGDIGAGFGIQGGAEMNSGNDGQPWGSQGNGQGGYGDPRFGGPGGDLRFGPGGRWAGPTGHQGQGGYPGQQGQGGFQLPPWEQQAEGGFRGPQMGQDQQQRRGGFPGQQGQNGFQLPPWEQQAQGGFRGPQWPQDQQQQRGAPQAPWGQQSPNPFANGQGQPQNQFGVSMNDQYRQQPRGPMNNWEGQARAQMNGPRPSAQGLLQGATGGNDRFSMSMGGR